jgi:hypothetical protein
MNTISLITEVIVILLVIALLVTTILKPKNVLIDLPLGFLKVIVIGVFRRIYLIIKLITLPVWLILCYLESRKIYSSWLLKKLTTFDKWITNQF